MKNWQKLITIFAIFMHTCSIVLAQGPMIVRGKVSDKDGITLPGVNIIIEGSTTGTVTDIDGAFSIQVVAGQNLMISFIGMETKIVPITSTDTFLDIMLLDASTMLDEMVVIGYGVQRKESVVGAIGTSTGEDLKVQGNVSNLRDALSGVIPGVSVLSTSGLAGGDVYGDGRISRETEILIRGRTTWNSAAPLILVDGVERDMNDVNVNEIESISVLKDASATAVFGVKGGNGVILITTKRGKAGKAQFNFEVETSLETPSKIVETASTVDGLIALNHATERSRRISGARTLSSYTSDEVLGYYRAGAYPYAFPDNDWMDIMFKDFAQSYRFNGQVNGGTDRVKYFASLGYYHFDDLINAQDLGQGYKPSFLYDRLNMRSNFDFEITPTTQLRANYSGIYSNQTSPPGTSVNAIFDGMRNLPGNSMVLQYEDGMYGAYNVDIARNNPYYALHYTGMMSTSRTTVNMDYTLNQDLSFITEGLTFSAKLAYDNLFVNNGGRRVNDNGLMTKTIDPEFYLQGGYYDQSNAVYMMDGQPIDDMEGAGWALYTQGSGGSLSAGFGWIKEPVGYNPEGLSLNRSMRTLYYETSLNYDRRFYNHAITGLAMFSRQQVELGSNWPSKREDWVGRLTYSYDDRYFLEFNGAFNGSEKFGPEYRFDFFPSVAGGWLISNESFIRDRSYSWLDNLKLRYSYGFVGNDNVRIPSMWPYLTMYVTDDWYSHLSAAFFGYPVSDFQYISYLEGIPGNPLLRWEKARKQNLGLDIELLRQRIVFSMDVFNEYRYDMLLAAGDRGVPDIGGMPPVAANIGEAESRGMELELTYRERFFNNTLNFWVKTNWAVARSNVIYKETPDLYPAYRSPEGFPIDQSRTTMSTGFISSWDDLYTNTGSNSSDENASMMPGDLILLDYNADGYFNRNDDRVPYGYPMYPQNNYGLTFGFDYKGIHLFTQFVGAYNVTRRIATGTFDRNSSYVPNYVLDHTWTPAYNNSNPTFPALALDDKYTPTGHYELFDGSFIRLQSVQLSYDLPKRFIRNVGLQNLRVYVNGRNLFLWTQMPDDGVGSAYTRINYPTKKQFNFGVNFQF